MLLKLKPHRLQQPMIAQLGRELRTTMQLSQEKFADEVGMTLARINCWENKHATPSPLALTQIETVGSATSQSPDATLRERSHVIQSQYFLDREQNA